VSRPGQRGQAAAELLGVLPALIALALAGWLLVAAAHAWLLADGAARAGAEAAAAGRDPGRAVREALPPGYRDSVRVQVERRPGRPPRVEVVLPAPVPVPWPGDPLLLRAGAGGRP
jgi:hypothetical protein